MKKTWLKRAILSMLVPAKADSSGCYGKGNEAGSAANRR